MRTLIKCTLAAAGLVVGASALSSCADSGYGAPSYDVAYGDPYWGWYGDYYYPGTGLFVYDRNRHRVPWTDEQRGYWEGRRTNWHGPNNHTTNWGTFRHHP